MRKLFTILIIAIFTSINVFSQNLVDDIKYHPGFDKSLEPFFHGVASGDATDSSVIIWTKVTPKKHFRSITVEWEIAIDSNMTGVVQQGRVYAVRNNDYTVNIEVNNLKPNTYYYYRFNTTYLKSQVGRTKTLPKTVSDNYVFRPVFFTGSNFNAGFFNAYKNICSRTDIDAVYHLGDYFYEYGTNVYGKNKNRPLMPDHEVITLQDYRTRFSHYRLDPDLREAHRLYCWYVIWDDHETADNSYSHGAHNHQPDEGSWTDRKNAAIKAYFEWMPIKKTKDSSIFNTFSVGNLARFILLDTRLEGRDDQHISPYDTTKSLLGDEQLDWFFSELLQAQKDSVKWIFITQQIMFAPLKYGKKVINNDQWDGYDYERRKILDFIKQNNINNVVIISGDIHTSWANEVYFDKKNKDDFIPEVITPSITSPSLAKFPAVLGQIFLRVTLRHIKFVNLSDKGYMILNITNKDIIAEWNFLKTIKYSDDRIKKTKFYTVKSL